MTVQDKTLEYSKGWETDADGWNRRLNDYLHQLGRHEEACRLSRCGFPRKLDGGRWQYFKACRQRLCAVCLTTRRRRKVEFWAARVQEMKAPVFITLTMRSVRHLNGIGDKATEAFSRLRDGKALAGCRGGFYCLEFTQAGSGLFHPHLHILADVPGGVSESALSREWKALTKAYVVDVQDIASQEGRQERLEYLLKAACPELNPEVVSGIYGAFKRGFQFFRSFGDFRARSGNAY